jgi:hypothetical protein
MTKLSLMKSSIESVVRQNNKFLECRDMLKEFIKLLPNISSISGFLREVDKHVNEDIEDLAPTVQRLLPQHLPFLLGVSMKNVTLAKLFKRDSFVADPLFKDIAKHFSEAAVSNEDGMLLFKVKSNGIFVAHTVNIPDKTANAIVLTAKKEKYNNIYIEPLKGFMYDLFGSKYEED